MGMGKPEILIYFPDTHGNAAYSGNYFPTA